MADQVPKYIFGERKQCLKYGIERDHNILNDELQSLSRTIVFN